MNTQLRVKTGVGDLSFKDALNLNQSKVMNRLRNRFAKYTHLVAEIGEAAAFETLMEKYPEQQKRLMGTLINGTTLAKGFQKAVPILRLTGFMTEVVDIAQNGQDAALEIQRACPAMAIAQEFGLATPCRVICDMELEGARRAFTDMEVSVLSRMADGDCVCIFKYERPAKIELDPVKKTSTFIQILGILKLVPSLLKIAVEMMKKKLFS
ncbi:MAG: hypothetical protein AAGC93_28315 [Cyanobacteria bacterium P01_F01_bin.53]